MANQTSTKAIQAMLQQLAVNPFAFASLGLAKLDQPIYDSTTYAAGQAAASVTLFQSPVGSGTTAKTYSDTNMTNAGKLPGGSALVIKSIQVKVSSPPAAAVVPPTITDIINFANGTHLEFQIGNASPQLYLPCVAFPGGSVPMQSAVSTTDTTTTIQSASLGTPGPNKGYVLDSPMVIGDEQNFQVRLVTDTVWTALAAGGSTFGQGLKVQVYLEGDFYRTVNA